VKDNTSYNVLIGRRILNQFGVILSTSHMIIKLLAKDETIIIVEANPKASCNIMLKPQSTPRTRLRLLLVTVPLKPTLLLELSKNVILLNNVTTLKRHLPLPLRRRYILIPETTSKRIVPLLMSPWSKFNLVLNTINSFVYFLYTRVMYLFS